jgi:formylglycine-generating enzyme required for sulfatase activity
MPGQEHPGWTQPLYPKISEMKFSAADENYLKAFTAWRESVLRPYREKLPEMVRIPAGKFLMGSPPFEEGRKSDETQHEVTISNDFLMGKYKVTKGEWLSVMGNWIEIQSRTEEKLLKIPFPCHGAWIKTKKSGPILKDYAEKFHYKTPVRVYYGYVRQYCDKLTEIHRQNGLIGKDLVFRLPTEAEWEYALRAGTTTAYFWGNNRSDGKPFGLDNRSSSNQLPDNVGSIGKPNPWGIYDMVGHNWYHSEFILDKPRNYEEGGTAFNRNKIDPVGVIIKVASLAGRFGSGYGVHDRGGLPFSWGHGYQKETDSRSAQRPDREPYSQFRIVLAKPIK